MNNPRFSLAALALVAGAVFAPAPARAAEPALDRLVPADAVLVFALEDLPGLRERAARSAFGRAWADPDVARFVAPLRSHPEYLKLVERVKAETGHTSKELLAFATGDVLLTVPLSSLKFSRAESEGDVLLALEVGDNEAKIRELVSKPSEASDQGRARVESVEDYNGVSIHLSAPAASEPAAPADPAAAAPTPEPSPGKTFAWALHQGRWFLATDRTLVVGALDALASGGLPRPLAEAETYRAVVDRAGGRPDYVFLADFQSVYPAMASGLEAGRNPASPPNPLGIEPANILRALGVDALDVLSATGAVLPDGSTRGDLVLSYREARGLVNLLAYRDGPVARPDWVPASWINVSSQNFSVPDLYTELQSMLDRLSPVLAGMANGQIKAFERQLKIDFARDLIGNLGPSVLSGITPPAGSSAVNPPPYDEMEQFFAVSLADAGAFERALEALKARFLPPGAAGPLQTREYLGRKLHVFTPPAGSPANAKGFAYAIADGWLMVSLGSAAPLESALQGLHKPDPAASFWARADVRAALADAPSGAFSIQFADLRPLFASLCALAVKMQAAREPEAAPFVDAAALPSTEVFARHLSYVVTHGERRPGALVVETSTPAAPAP